MKKEEFIESVLCENNIFEYQNGSEEDFYDICLEYVKEYAKNCIQAKNLCDEEYNALLHYYFNKITNVWSNELYYPIIYIYKYNLILFPEDDIEDIFKDLDVSYITLEDNLFKITEDEI